MIDSPSYFRCRCRDLTVLAVSALLFSCSEPSPTEASHHNVTVTLDVTGAQGERVALRFTTPQGNGRRTVAHDTIDVTPGARRLSSIVDITECVDDARTCTLFVAVVLVGQSGVPLDSTEVGPLLVQPGIPATAPSISLVAAGRLGLSSKNLSLIAGDTSRIVAKVVGRNGDTLSTRSVEWRSRAANVATVSGSGLVQAIAPGTTVLVVTSGEASDSALVSVYAPLRVVLSTAALLMPEGDSASVTATVSGGLPGTNLAFGWQSRDPAIATVNSAGRVIAVASGATWLVARATADARVADSIAVTVHAPLRISLSAGRSQLIVGDTTTLTASVSGGATGTSRAVTWVSRNPSVATLSSSGVATALSTGSTWLVARASADARVADSVTVAVFNPLSVTLSPRTLQLTIGDTASVSASVSGGLPGTGQGLVWQSRNTAVASVSATGQATAIANGSTWLVARSASVSSVADSARVTVGSVAALVLRGNATLLAPNRLRLTESIDFQIGGAWTSTPRAIAGGFVATFQFQIANPGGLPDVKGNPGGDGFAFVIQSEGITALGGGGNGQGYGGITRSLAVEFDQWEDLGVPDWPSGNHVSVQTNGLLGNRSETAYRLAGADVPVNMSDGAVHDVRIEYVPGTLSVYLDNQLTVTAAVTLTNIGGVSILDASQRAWVGFTAATGSAREEHYILNWVLP